MTAADWADPSALALALYLDGSDDPDRAADGSPLLDDDFLVLVNAWWEPLGFTVPATRAAQTWQCAIDSYDPSRSRTALRAGELRTVDPRSVVVLRGPARPRETSSRP
jgi:glycogen operon protein